MLVNAACSCCLLETLLFSVRGCVDSFAVFCKDFPGQPNNKQEHLVNSLFYTLYKAHDVMEDVIFLSLLFTKTMIPDNDLLAYSFAPDAVYNNLLVSKTKSKNITSLEILIAKGIVKRATVENIAGSGLNLMYLYQIYQRNGEDGLYAIVSQTGEDSSPRVTNVKKKWLMMLFQNLLCAMKMNSLYDIYLFIFFIVYLIGVYWNYDVYLCFLCMTLFCLCVLKRISQLFIEIL